jgi:hypothetical protein
VVSEFEKWNYADREELAKIQEGTVARDEKIKPWLADAIDAKHGWGDNGNGFPLVSKQ